jgi:hypothetical protein
MKFENEFYTTYTPGQEEEQKTKEKVRSLYTKETVPVYIDTWLLEQSVALQNGSDTNKIAAFKDSPQQQAFTFQLKSVINSLKAWCKDNRLQNADSWDKITNGVLPVGANGLAPTTALAIYSEGKRSLEFICAHYLSLGTKVTLRDLTAMRNFINDNRLDFCHAGFHVGLIFLHYFLQGGTWPEIIHNMRYEFIQQSAKEFTTKRKILDYNGMEIHSVSSLCNFVSETFCIPLARDVYKPRFLTDSLCLDFRFEAENNISDCLLEKIVEYLHTELKAINNYDNAEIFNNRFNQLGYDPHFKIANLLDPTDGNGCRVVDGTEPAFQLRCSLITRFVTQNLLNSKATILKCGEIALHMPTENFAWSWTEVHVKHDENEYFIKREPLIVIDPKFKFTPPKAFDARSLLIYAANNRHERLLTLILKAKLLTSEEVSKINCGGGMTLLHLCLARKSLNMLLNLLDGGFTLLPKAANQPNCPSVWSLAADWKEEFIYSIFLQHLSTDKLQIEVNTPSVHDALEQTSLLKLKQVPQLEFDAADLVALMKFSKTLNQIKIGNFAALLDCKHNAKKHWAFFAELLYEAVLKSDTTEAENLLSMNAPLTHTHTKNDQFYGYSVLHIAVARGNTDLTSVLLLAGADPLKGLKRKPEITPLTLALKSGNLQLIRLILQFIFDSETVDSLVKECSNVSSVYSDISGIINARLQAETAKQSMHSFSPAQDNAMKAYFEKFSNLIDEPQEEEACQLCISCTIS